MILSIYQAVVLGETGAAVMTLGAAAAYSWFLKQLASVFEASRDVLDSWQRELHRIPRWGRAFHKSCGLISVPVGSFFFVDNGLILTVLSIVVDNSASLILAYRQ